MIYEDLMTQSFNLIYTSWPIILYACYDYEHPKKTLLDNPILYREGIRNEHFNIKVFSQWLFFTLLQSVLLLVVTFSAMRFAPDVLGGGGKTPDIWLVGTLLYGGIVAVVNCKVLQDSHSHTGMSIVINVLSTLTFFGVFSILDLFKHDQLYAQFDEIWQYPQFIGVYCFMLLFMWPINTFNFFCFKSKRFEKHQKFIEQNKLKLDEEREVEQEGLVLPQPSPEFAQQKLHTGFAFSGEEGHVPQITEKLSQQVVFD